MINFTTIENTLVKIEALYNASTDSHLQILYSKLAILELSGWLEESFDEILHEYLNNKVTTDYITLGKEIIKKNNGIHWDKIRLMINNIIGVSNLETIESLLESSLAGISIIKPFLNTLTPNRNIAAHTSILVSRTFDAPSVTIGQFRRIKPILVEIENLISCYI